MNSVKLLALDLDGTLLDTVRDLGTAANVTLAHFGFPQHPLEAYQGFIGNGLLMLYRRPRLLGRMRRQWRRCATMAGIITGSTAPG